MNINERTLTLHVPGDLISTTALAVRSEMDALIEANDKMPRKWNVFRLDLAAAQMIDSVGLNLVVTLFKSVRKRGARMQVAYSSPNILRTFAFTRLDTHVELIKV